MKNLIQKNSEKIWYSILNLISKLGGMLVKGLFMPRFVSQSAKVRHFCTFHIFGGIFKYLKIDIFLLKYKFGLVSQISIKTNNIYHLYSFQMNYMS